MCLKKGSCLLLKPSPYLSKVSGINLIVRDPGLESSEEGQEPQLVAEATSTRYAKENVVSRTHSVDANITSTYPTVRLDAERITDATAGRLATSFLGHVLFLKNQIPLPVMQLGRIPNTKMNSRVSKQRIELLNSFDTISSHFETTFSALSTALARSPSPQRLSRVYLVFLLGPSIGMAKSKVILGIDGLETRIWGSLDNLRPNHRICSERSDSEYVPESKDDDQRSCPEEIEEEADESEDDVDETDEGDASEDDESSENGLSPPGCPPSGNSHAEEQKFLQNAERLLSRTLAMSDATGNGLGAELTPTQIHVIIRAPRRFSHPAWIPRQNITAALDVILDDFLRISDQNNPNQTVEKTMKQPKVEGVWITTCSGLQKPSQTIPLLSPLTEEDDMIWWNWDGRLSGFADW